LGTIFLSGAEEGTIFTAFQGVVVLIEVIGGRSDIGAFGIARRTVKVFIL
jgi:hypothetical protein